MRALPRVALCSLGRGLFAARDYKPGDLIMVLHGPRRGRDDPLHFTPDGANLLQTGKLSYILLQPPGVFVNHSCEPNAGIARHRRLVAIRPIIRNEEIRFDYSTTMDEDFWTMECKCGSPYCRGVVRDFVHLPADVRSHYLAMGIVPGFIARKFCQSG
jgi:hypothetical protein